MTVSQRTTPIKGPEGIASNTYLIYISFGSAAWLPYLIRIYLLCVIYGL